MEELLSIFPRLSDYSLVPDSMENSLVAERYPSLWKRSKVASEWKHQAVNFHTLWRMFPSLSQINVCVQANEQVTRWQDWVWVTSMFYLLWFFCVKKNFQPIANVLCGSVRTLILSVTSQSSQQTKQSTLLLPAIVHNITWKINPDFRQFQVKIFSFAVLHSYISYVFSFGRPENTIGILYR